MGHHKRVEGELSSGRLRLHDEADVGGIVEGAWENVDAGRRHVGSFVVYYPSQPNVNNRPRKTTRCAWTSEISEVG